MQGQRDTNTLHHMIKIHNWSEVAVPNQVNSNSNEPRNSAHLGSKLHVYVHTVACPPIEQKLFSNHFCKFASKHILKSKPSGGYVIFQSFPNIA